MQGFCQNKIGYQANHIPFKNFQGVSRLREWKGRSSKHHYCCIFVSSRREKLVARFFPKRGGGEIPPPPPLFPPPPSGAVRNSSQNGFALNSEYATIQDKSNFRERLPRGFAPRHLRFAPCTKRQIATVRKNPFGLSG